MSKFWITGTRLTTELKPGGLDTMFSYINSGIRYLSLRPAPKKRMKGGVLMNLYEHYVNHTGKLIHWGTGKKKKCLRADHKHCKTWDCDMFEKIEILKKDVCCCGRTMMGWLIGKPNVPEKKEKTDGTTKPKP